MFTWLQGITTQIIHHERENSDVIHVNNSDTILHSLTSTKTISTPNSYHHLCVFLLKGLKLNLNMRKQLDKYRLLNILHLF